MMFISLSSSLLKMTTQSCIIITVFPSSLAGALQTIAAETARLSGEAREELDDDPFADLAELDENELLDK